MKSKICGWSNNNKSSSNNINKQTLPPFCGICTFALNNLNEIRAGEKQENSIKEYQNERASVKRIE